MKTYKSKLDSVRNYNRKLDMLELGIAAILFAYFVALLS